MMRSLLVVVGAVAWAVAAVEMSKPVSAAESATSFYLLGSKGSMAGFTPPPGLYVVDMNYFYGGSASGEAALGVTLRRTGQRDLLSGTRLDLEANLKASADAYYQMPTAIWVAPGQVLGGNAGLNLTVPIGWKSISADINALTTVTFPTPLSTTLTKGRSLALDDQKTAFGDPVLSAFLGWHQGFWHWSLGTMINVPIGQWGADRLANIGFNHWAFDFNGAVTWLNTTTGLELSSALGFTFNTENPDSHYKSGDDFHVEFAAVQNFSKSFGIGVTGYHYQQLTGDSGSGAVLGDFKGRVTGVGPTLNYNFQVGPLPISTSLKWIHEFNAQNRLTGDMGMFNVLIPLGPAPPATAKP